MLAAMASQRRLQQTQPERRQLSQSNQTRPRNDTEAHPSDANSASRPNPQHLDYRILTDIIHVQQATFPHQQQIRLQPNALCFRRTTLALLQCVVQTSRKSPWSLTFAKYAANETSPLHVNFASAKLYSTLQARYCILLWKRSVRRVERHLVKLSMKHQPHRRCFGTSSHSEH